MQRSLILKIESWRGVENAEAMLSNEWVDAVVFGPGDLAAKMGFHGEWEHPQVVAAMERVIEIALSRNLPVEPAIYPEKPCGVSTTAGAWHPTLWQFQKSRIQSIAGSRITSDVDISLESIIAQITSSRHAPYAVASVS